VSRLLRKLRFVRSWETGRYLYDFEGQIRAYGSLGNHVKFFWTLEIKQLRGNILNR